MVQRHKEKGSVLISVIVVLMLASMGALALTITLQDYAVMQGKNRQELQAYYAAEAGVLEVIGWFNTSGTAVAGTYPTLAPMFARNDDDVYQTLADSLPSGGINIGEDYGENLLPVLRDGANKVRGWVSSLIIYPPTDFPEEFARIPKLICVVRSDGETPAAGHKRIYLFVAYHRLKLDGAPSCIMSRAAIEVSGDCKAHWGEVWSRTNLVLPNKSKTPTQLQDPWLRFRAEAKLEFAANWGVSKWGVPYHAGAEGDIVDGTDYPCRGVAYSNISEFSEMMHQNQTLDWPIYDYEAAKKIAKMKGRYYSTDAAGNVYRDGIEDNAHLVGDLNELNVSGDRGDWANVDYDMVFVDTIDGQEPLADGTNLASLRLSGSGASWKGFYYICANLDVRGMGSPSDIAIKNPDGVYYNKGAFMDGILCVQGAYIGSGNELIYGALYAKRGFLGTGTPDVYYNVDLRNGIPFPIDNRVELIMWRVVN